MVLGKTQTPLPSFPRIYFSSSLHRELTVPIIEPNSMCNNTADTLQLSLDVVTQELAQVLLNVCLCWWFEVGRYSKGRALSNSYWFLFISCLKPPANY